MKLVRSKLSMLNPEQLFYWNLFILLTNMILVIYLPYKYFFFFSFPSVTQSQIIITSIILFLQIIEILIKLHTRSDMLGSDLESRTKVKKNYIGLELILDILSVIGICSMFLPETDWPIIRLLIYCKLPSIMKYDRHISITIKSEIFDFCYILIKVIFLYIVYCNFTAGAFFKIDFSYYTQEGEYYYDQMIWLQYSESMKNIIDFSAPVHYVYSMFWSIITASCTGYGDLTPLNPVQVLLTIFVFVPNVLLFGFMIDNINFKFDQMREKSRTIRQSEVAILRLLRDAGVRKETFYQLKYHIGKMVVKQLSEEKSITDFLTSSLATELTLQLFKQPLRRLNNVSVQDLNVLFPVIYQSVSFEKESIYPGVKYHFVIEGKGNIVLSGIDYCSFLEGSAQIKQYHCNDTLNTYSFLSQKSNKFIKYKTVQYTRLYIIQKPPDTLSFRNRSNQVMIDRKYLKFGIECEICKAGQHILQKCPFFCHISQRNRKISTEKQEYQNREWNNREYYRRHQQSNQIEYGFREWRYIRFEQKYLKLY